MSDRSTPLVSIVVPCFNYGRFLPDCLESILQQDARYSMEVILVDDRSTDNTQEILSGYAGRDARLRVFLHERNRGHVVTVNEGLAAARGKYVARIDPDDRYRQGFLAALVPVLERFEDVGMAYGDAAMIDEKGEVTAPSCDVVHGGRTYHGDEFVPLLKRNFICAPTALARREAWLAALPIPEGLAFNDWYFNIMIARAWNLYYVNDVVADYRVHGSNHHARIARDRTEERSLFWLLDRVYAQPEPHSQAERRKQRARGEVYGSHYLDLAEKYFGYGMERDARRCYLAAGQRHLPLLLRPGPIRRLAATLIGRGLYERGKSLVRTVRSGQTSPTR
jgi:glycosyltransferase involved in cell wall biosynthesis